MTEEHVHDVALRTRIGDDGQRVYEAVGPCLSCGEPIEPIPPVTQAELELSQQRRVTWTAPEGGSHIEYARGKLDG